MTKQHYHYFKKLFSFLFYVLTSLFSSFSSKPMLIESNDLPLRGNSFLFEYMLKYCCFFFFLQFSNCGNNLRYVGCLPREAALFAIYPTRETGGGNNLYRSSKWKKSSAAHVSGGKGVSFISLKGQK